MPYSSMGANLEAIAWENAAVPVVVMSDNGRRSLNGTADTWSLKRRTPDAGRMSHESDAGRMSHESDAGRMSHESDT